MLYVVALPCFLLLHQLFSFVAHLFFSNQKAQIAARYERLHAFAIGKVQGVWMRAHTADQAKTLGLTGWCQNVASGPRRGQVEIVAEGPREHLEKLLLWVKAGGSPAARVDQVEAEFSASIGEFSNFEIKK